MKVSYDGQVESVYSWLMNLLKDYPEIASPLKDEFSKQYPMADLATGYAALSKAFHRASQQMLDDEDWRDGLVPEIVECVAGRLLEKAR